MTKNKCFVALKFGHRIKFIKNDQYALINFPSI